MEVHISSEPYDDKVIFGDENENDGVFGSSTSRSLSTKTAALPMNSAVEPIFMEYPMHPYARKYADIYRSDWLPTGENNKFISNCVVNAMSAYFVTNAYDAQSLLLFTSYDIYEQDRGMSCLTDERVRYFASKSVSVRRYASYMDKTFWMFPRVFGGNHFILVVVVRPRLLVCSFMMLALSVLLFICILFFLDEWFELPR